MTYYKDDKTVDERLFQWGRSIRNHRINRNLTQAALAKEAGVSLRTLIRLEEGQSVQSKTLIKVIVVLGLADNLAQLIPVIPVSPLALAKHDGNKPKRVRTKAKDQAEQEEWAWGDTE